ncbi:hypothetical protein ACWEWX_51245, partial [Streptomyces asiaticus]
MAWTTIRCQENGSFPPSKRPSAPAPCRHASSSAGCSANSPARPASRLVLPAERETLADYYAERIRESLG